MPSLIALPKVCPHPTLSAASPCLIFILALVTSEGALVIAGLFVYCEPPCQPLEHKLPESRDRADMP